MRISFFTLLFVCALSCAGADTIVSKARILATHPDQVYSLEMPGKKLLATIKNQGSRRMPREQLSLWLQRTNDYRLLRSISAGVGGSFDQPRVFMNNGLSFIYAPTQPAGSGGFVDQYIFWIAPDDSLHRINFEPASVKFENQSKPGEIVVSGGPKDFFIEDNQLKFEFWLGKEGDPHCCPSLGTVTGTYKVVGNPNYDFFSHKYSDDIRIQVDTWNKKPEPKSIPDKLSVRLSAMLSSSAL